MSRSSDFWESVDNRWCRLLTVSTGDFTAYNTSVMGSVVCMITAFYRRILVTFLLIPCISRIPILEGKFLSKNAAYTRANTVFCDQSFLWNVFSSLVMRRSLCIKIMFARQHQISYKFTEWFWSWNMQTDGKTCTIFPLLVLFMQQHIGALNRAGCSLSVRWSVQVHTYSEPDVSFEDSYNSMGSVITVT
jgi:hypothetical protein